MYCSIYGADIFGTEARIIRIEADINDGLPVFDMVGFLASAVKEARERVRISLRNAGVRFPAKRITVNLSPANLRKEGTSFDLPIAIALMTAFGQLPAEAISEYLIVGELGLDGCVRAIPGVLAMVLEGQKQGLTRFIVPADNAREAALASGTEIYGVNTLTEALLFLRGELQIQSEVYNGLEEVSQEIERDFREVSGQKMMKRAMEIAVAGMHNLLIIGPPGSGKTMAASCMPGIMPKLSEEERLEITRLYSICGIISKEEPVVKARPFRAPHHTLTPTALTGGGRVPIPGELSLASKGVLFLDELPEFSRETLEVLRQPLEEHKVRISRVGHSYEYDCDCLVVAAMNPCRCGNFHNKRKCRCTVGEVRKYLNKISEPLLERMDLCVQSEPIEALWEDEICESSAQIRKRVEKAVKCQRERYQDERFCFNSFLSERDIKKYCVLTDKQKKFLQDYFEANDISMRQISRMLKVARTIADLNEHEQIEDEDLAEAICFRSINKRYWGDVLC